MLENERAAVYTHNGPFGKYVLKNGQCFGVLRNAISRDKYGAVNDQEISIGSGEALAFRIVTGVGPGQYRRSVVKRSRSNMG